MIKKSFFVLSIAVILITMAPMVTNANPYMGCYLDVTARTSLKVIFCCNFGGTTPSQIPVGNALKAVISVTGSASGQTNSDGWVYQGGLQLCRNGTVLYIPQAWFGGGSPAWGPKIYNGGSYTAPLIYSRMVMDTGAGVIHYKCYSYANSQQVEQDTPTIKSVDQTIPAGTTAFLVGTKTYNGNVYHFLQAGAEANSQLSISWKEQNDRIGYWTGSAWRYESGYVCWHASSHIAWIGSTPYGVGDSNFSGVNINTSSSDLVQWKYTGSAITDGSQLWYGGGVPSTPPNTPFS